MTGGNTKDTASEASGAMGERPASTTDAQIMADSARNSTIQASARVTVEKSTVSDPQTRR